MGYNKIPLALGFNDSTGNASGLVEFTLNLSDVGNVCGNKPETGQALVYNSDGQYCPSTLPAPGEFTGNLSDVGQVCSATPEEGQALVWSGTGVWCPSTIPTGGGGGGYTPPTATSVGEIIISDSLSQFNDTITSAALFTEGIADNQILTGTIGPDNLDSATGSFSANDLPFANSTTQWDKIATTADLRAFLATDAKLSSLTDVCEDTPSDYQALVWDGDEWCPSTIPTGGVTSVNGDTGPAVALNLSDVGDICEDSYNPSPGDVLTYNSALNCWTPSATPAVAAGALSALTDVCDGVTSVTQYQALVWNGSAWCPSTIPTGGGGGGVTSVNGDTGPAVALYLSSLSAVSFTDLQAPQHLEWDGTNWVNSFEDVQYFRVYNAGSSLSKGSAVFVSGAHNANVAEVGLAQANSADTMPAIGIILEDLSIGNEGLAVTFGRAAGLALSSPTYAEGDTLYISPTTPGGVTNQKPTDPTHLIQNIGIVTKTNATNGVAKITGVGRANDIPNTITLGATTITSASAKFANVDADHILISTAASATSSIASATLFSQGITDNDIVTSVNSQTGPSVSLNTGDITEVANSRYVTDAQEAQVDFLNLGSQLTLNTTPLNLNSIPAGNLQDTYLTSLTGVNPSDLDTGTSVSDGQLVKRVDGSSFTGVATTSQSETFLGTQANLDDLTDVNASPAEGAVLQRTGSNTWTHRYFEENSVVITDSASAVSSLSGASGSIIYFEGATPAPGLQQIGQIMQNAGERVEDHNIEDLANVSQGETAGWPNGCILQYDEEALGGEGAFVSAAIPGIDATDSGSVSIKIDHGAGLSGLGDDDHTQYVLADGTRVVSGTLSALDFSATSGSVASTPTAANHIANKSYVDSQVTTPSYFQALASGTITLSVDATEYDLGWSTSGTYAITDPAGNLEVQDGDSQGNNINVSGDGVYQIDCSVQTSNSFHRCGSVLRIYRDIGDGDGFTEISELRSSNYASRGLENIVTGSTHLNTLLSLDAGDKLKFTIMRNNANGTPTATTNGTYLRIVKIA